MRYQSLYFSSFGPNWARRIHPAQGTGSRLALLLVLGGAICPEVHASVSLHAAVSLAAVLLLLGGEALPAQLLTANFDDAASELMEVAATIFAVSMRLSSLERDLIAASLVKIFSRSQSPSPLFSPFLV